MNLKHPLLAASLGHGAAVQPWRQPAVSSQPSRNCAMANEDAATPGLPPIRFGEMTEEETAARIELLIASEGEHLRSAFPATNDLAAGLPAPDATVLTLDGTPVSLLAHVGTLLDAHPASNAVAINFGSAT